MSWGAYTPWPVLECMSTCFEKDDNGYYIHVPGCPVGKMVEDREREDKAFKEKYGVDRQECLPKYGTEL